MPSIPKKSINALFALIIMAGYVPSALAQGNNIDIKADEQEFADDRMIARGKVVVVKGDTVVYAPVATLYKDVAGQPERAVFTGHPRLAQGQNKIHADTLTFHIKTSVIIADGHAHSEVISTSEEKEKPSEDGTEGKTKKTTRTIVTDSNKQEFEQQTGRFEATGNVRVVTQDTVVNSDHMKLVYGNDRKAEAAVFTGKVKARQNKNLTEADNMTYFFNTQRLQANGHVRSRVVEEGGKDTSLMPEVKSPVAQKPRIVGTAGGAIAASTKSNVYNTFSESEDKQPPIIIHSDSQDYNKETGRMDAVGNVKVEYQDTRGSGSHVVMVKNMDGETEKVVFLGRSQIIQPGRRWIGDRITLVMKDRKVIAEGNTRAYIIQSGKAATKMANFGPNLKNDVAAPAPKQKPIKNVTQFAEDEKKREKIN